MTTHAIIMHINNDMVNVRSIDRSITTTIVFIAAALHSITMQSPSSAMTIIVIVSRRP